MAGHEVSSPHHDDSHASVHRTYNDTEQSVQAVVFRSPEHGDAGGSHASGHGEAVVPASYSGDWYTLYESGTLRLSIGWYIDSITVLMFVVVTFIATCIHFYAAGYMHDELHDVTDSKLDSQQASHFIERVVFRVSFSGYLYSVFQCWE